VPAKHHRHRHRHRRYPRPRIDSPSGLHNPHHAATHPIAPSTTDPGPPSRYTADVRNSLESLQSMTLEEFVGKYQAHTDTFDRTLTMSSGARAGPVPEPEPEYAGEGGGSYT
jgi:hypothetical protein